MSVDWSTPASVHRTEGEVRTDIAEGPLARMVERFLAEPDEQRHALLLRRGDEEMRLDAVRALHARDDFPGAY